jgi:hypothetical protein
MYAIRNVENGNAIDISLEFSQQFFGNAKLRQDIEEKSKKWKLALGSVYPQAKQRPMSKCKKCGIMTSDHSLM